MTRIRATVTTLTRSLRRYLELPWGDVQSQQVCACITQIPIVFVNTKKNNGNILVTRPQASWEKPSLLGDVLDVPFR